jgi:hypothetical protein
MTTVTVDNVMIQRPTNYSGGPSSNPATGQQTYSVNKIIASNVPNLVGAGAGDQVTTVIAFADIINQANFPPSTNYNIQLSCNQPCSINWVSKTTAGFSVVLTPLSGSLTIAAGLMDIEVTFFN